MAVAAHHHHSRTGVIRHDLMANATAYIVKLADALFFHDVAHLLILVGQLAAGGRRVVVEHDEQLIRVSHPLAVHLFERSIDAGGIIVGEDKVWFLENDTPSGSVKDFFDKSSSLHSY